MKAIKLLAVIMLLASCHQVKDFETMVHRDGTITMDQKLDNSSVLFRKIIHPVVEGDSVMIVNKFFYDRVTGDSFYLSDTFYVSSPAFVWSLSGGPSYEDVVRWNTWLEERYEELYQEHKKCKH